MLFDPWVAAGVILLIVWLVSQMLLLSWADLSYVLPVTSAGYVLTAISGRLFLNEHISMARWAGVTLIMAGVVLVGAVITPSGGRFPVDSTFNSAIDVYGSPLTSLNARSRTYCPIFGVNTTCCSVATLASVPVATAVPHVTPSRLT